MPKFPSAGGQWSLEVCRRSGGNWSVLKHRPGAQLDEPGGDEARPPTGPTDPKAPAVSRRHHRRWPLLFGVVGIIVLALVVLVVATWDPAHPVTMGHAEQRLGGNGQEVAGGRPAPGVYLYTGTGADKLTLPPA